MNPAVPGGLTAKERSRVNELVDLSIATDKLEYKNALRVLIEDIKANIESNPG